MPKIFSDWQIASLHIANRLVRSATWEGAANEVGEVTDRLVKYYLDLANGGVGLIISGYMYVRPDGIGNPGQTGIFRDEQTAGLQRITRAVHNAGAKVACQIVHCGGQVSRKLLQDGVVPLAPSDHFFKAFRSQAQAMSATDIASIVAAFGDAARRAQEAGFDAVQLHSAHGYLINQFLSRHTNQRTDGYGGALAARFRFAREVVAAVRGRVGDSYPVGVKLNSQDFVDGGLSLGEAMQFAAWYEQAGIDFIEVSGGVPDAGRDGPARAVEKGPNEAYFLGNARRIKAVVSIPVIGVGGWRTPQVIEAVLDAGGLDAVAMSRPFIAEPDLAARWRSGDPLPAKCISCNGCFGTGLKAGGIYCTQKEKGRL